MAGEGNSASEFLPFSCCSYTDGEVRVSNEYCMFGPFDIRPVDMFKE
jgi:hypothetical protein